METAWQRYCSSDPPVLALPALPHPLLQQALRSKNHTELGSAGYHVLHDRLQAELQEALALDMAPPPPTSDPLLARLARATRVLVLDFYHAVQARPMHRGFWQDVVPIDGRLISRDAHRSAQYELLRRVDRENARLLFNTTRPQQGHHVLGPIPSPLIARYSTTARQQHMEAHGFLPRYTCLACDALCTINEENTKHHRPRQFRDARCLHGATPIAEHWVKVAIRDSLAKIKEVQALYDADPIPGALLRYTQLHPEPSTELLLQIPVEDDHDTAADAAAYTRISAPETPT